MKSYGSLNLVLKTMDVNLKKKKEENIKKAITVFSFSKELE
jgi:hypothetical protein